MNAATGLVNASYEPEIKKKNTKYDRWACRKGFMRTLKIGWLLILIIDYQSTKYVSNNLQTFPLTASNLK